MSGFLELFSQYDVLGAFLVNIELTLWSALFSLILAIFYKQFSWKMLYDSLIDTAKTSAMVFIILFGASAFTGIFMSMLDISGQQLTSLTPYNEYLTDVIIAVIVYLSAFSLVIKMLFTGRKKRKAAEAAPAEHVARTWP